MSSIIPDRPNLPHFDGVPGLNSIKRVFEVHINVILVEIMHVEVSYLLEALSIRHKTAREKLNTYTFLPSDALQRTPPSHGNARAFMRKAREGIAI